MSRFYASIGGSANTEATRQGTQSSGITGHIRGWDSGIRVEGRARGDEDEFLVFATHGSNGGGSDQYIGILKGNDFTPSHGLDLKSMGP